MAAIFLQNPLLLHFFCLIVEELYSFLREWGLFLWSISLIFYEQLLRHILAQKKFKAKLWLEKICPKYFCTNEAASKTLMKLTHGLNFINVLHTALELVDPKSVKRFWQFDWILMLLGAMCAKAACRMLMKLTPVHQKYLVGAFHVRIDRSGHDNSSVNLFSNRTVRVWGIHVRVLRAGHHQLTGDPSIDLNFGKNNRK